MYLKALAASKDIMFMEEPIVLMKISPVEPIDPLGALQLSVLLHMLIYSLDSVKKPARSEGDWEGENKSASPGRSPRVPRLTICVLCDNVED